jgi:hypothetical protein
MYIDKCLKFESEEQANNVLYTTHPAVLNEETQEIVSEEYITPNYQNIDIIGTIYNLDGIYDGEGNVIQEATKKAGWHVNVRLTLSEDGTVLEPFAVEPKQPRRVWA